MVDGREPNVPHQVKTGYEYKNLIAPKIFDFMKMKNKHMEKKDYIVNRFFKRKSSSRKIIFISLDTSRNRNPLHKIKTHNYHSSTVLSTFRPYNTPSDDESGF